MGQPREDLQTIFEAITPNVYFEPPSNLQMVYPCIRYELSDVPPNFASNKPYERTKKYQATVITQSPSDWDLHLEVGALPLCRFDRHFKAADLNHDVYNIFF